MVTRAINCKEKLNKRKQYSEINLIKQKKKKPLHMEQITMMRNEFHMSEILIKK